MGITDAGGKVLKFLTGKLSEPHAVKANSGLVEIPRDRIHHEKPSPFGDTRPLSDQIRAELAKHTNPAAFDKILNGEAKKAEGKGNTHYWCLRCRRAEQENEKLRSVATLLVKERDLLRDRILAMCLAIRQKKFQNFFHPDPGGPSACGVQVLEITDFPPFLDIERFARGAPKEQGTPLREFPLDGKREVKRIKSSDYILECGHIKVYKPGEATPKLRERVVCDLCTAMLKERGELEEGQPKKGEKV